MGNKYFVIDNGSLKSISIKKELFKILEKNNWEYNQNYYDYLFIIGGDGTFLKSLNYFKDKKIIAINGGNLGYYSEFNKFNLKNIVKNITNNNNFSRMILLKLLVNNHQYFCLNEIYIKSDSTLKGNVYINHCKLEFFKGTGLMIVTPMGSTAHSKNAGGALIYKNLKVIELIEIHPLSQKGYSTLKSPLILPANTTIEFVNKQTLSQIDLILDGRLINKKAVDNLKIVAVESDFKFYCPNSTKSYISKLKHSFIRGE